MAEIYHALNFSERERHNEIVCGLEFGREYVFEPKTILQPLNYHPRNGAPRLLVQRAVFLGVRGWLSLALAEPSELGKGTTLLARVGEKLRRKKVKMREIWLPTVELASQRLGLIPRGTRMDQIEVLSFSPSVFARDALFLFQREYVVPLVISRSGPELRVV